MPFSKISLLLFIFITSFTLHNHVIAMEEVRLTKEQKDKAKQALKIAIAKRNEEYKNLSCWQGPTIDYSVQLRAYIDSSHPL